MRLQNDVAVKYSCEVAVSIYHDLPMGSRARKDETSSQPVNA